MKTGIPLIMKRRPLPERTDTAPRDIYTSHDNANPTTMPQLSATYHQHNTMRTMRANPPVDPSTEETGTLWR